MPVKVIAKVYEDSTGQYLSVPVLMTDEGVIISLLQYTLSKKRNGASRSTLNVLIKSVQLFVDYILANASSKNDIGVLGFSPRKRTKTSAALTIQGL